jgi:hypothetical protein
LALTIGSALLILVALELLKPFWRAQQPLRMARPPSVKSSMD